MTNILGLFIVLNIANYTLLNEKKALRYRNWYRPWLLLILALVGYALFPKVDTLVLTFIPAYINSLEIIFCIVIVTGWLFLKSLLKAFSVNDKLESILKKYNSNKVIEKQKGFANYLVWPYFIDEFNIYFRPGFKLFKNLFWVSIVIVFLSYLWTVFMTDKSQYILPTYLGLLSISIFLEWIIYFECSISKVPEKVIPENEEENQADFYKLFKRYINKDKGFYDSIIYAYNRLSTSETQNLQENNQSYLDGHLKNVINNNSDLIIGSNNFTDTLPNIADLLFDTLKKGGNILLIADIPNHTTYKAKSVGINYEHEEEQTVAKLFAIYLQQTLEHQMPSARNLMDIGFYSSNDNAGLQKRIVLCSIDDSVSSELIQSQWMQELDLKIVFQFNDAYLDNLSVRRQFSLWLEEQKRTHKSVFFKRYSTGGDEAVSNTWISTKDVPEVNLQNIQTANKNYFINFAYEHSIHNLNKILVGHNSENDITPGMELSVFPIMENVNHIHFFEGYNLDYIQSKNKLEKLQSSFSSDKTNPDSLFDYNKNATQAKLMDAILVNNLPFIVHPFDKTYCEDKHLSIIYDAENNAPKLYQKYKHLGKDESFICIITKPHLFREYFAENIDYFSSVTIESLEPQLSKSKINLCLQLLNLLHNEFVDIEFIKNQINAHSIELKEQSIVSFLREIFHQYLHIDISKNAILKSKSEYIFKNANYYHLHTLTMDKQNLEVNDIYEYLQKVKVVNESRAVILEIPKYLLFQNFLPQQNIIINGLSYSYNQFNDKSKELVLRTHATENFSFHKPKSRIEILNHEAINSIDIKNNPGYFSDGKPLQFSSILKETEIEIYYSDYYKFDRFYHSPFSKRQTPEWIDLAQYENLKEDSLRKYNTRFLHLCWEVPEVYYSKLPELTTRIHQLIYEFLPVLFPHRNQYIQIVSNNELEETHRLKTPWIFPDNNFKFQGANCIELFIVEDSFADLGILKPIQNYFEKILKDLYFLLTWMKDEDACIPSSFVEYVQGTQFFKDKLQFLKYGLEDEEINWDIDLLLEFLKDSKLFDISTIGIGYKKTCEESIASTLEVECDYCRVQLKLKDAQIMEDGLHRCMSCGIGAVDDIETANQLEKEAMALYSKHFNIDFEQIKYKFNFVTATEMHQYFEKPFFVTNKYDKRVCVGLASDREIDLIHVEKFYDKCNTISIIIHEMMHIYQYQRLNYFKIKNTEIELIEGMTTYAEYLLLSQSGVPEYIAYAEKYDHNRTNDQSEYGIGYRYVKEKYGDQFLKKIDQKFRI